MEFYSREEIAEQKKRRDGFRLAAYIVSGLAFASVVIMLFLVKPLNQTRLNVAAAVIAGLAGSFDIYVASFIMPYLQPKPEKKGALRSVLRVLSNIVHQLHMYLIWIILSAIILSFAFGKAGDTRQHYKVEIFADVAEVDTPLLETVLEERLPEGIKMIKPYLISHSLFLVTKSGDQDIYILPASHADEMIEGLAPLDDVAARSEAAGETGFRGLCESAQVYEKNGKAYGLLLWPEGTAQADISASEAARRGVQLSGEYRHGNSQVLILSPDGRAGENYYIFFGAGAGHLDDAASARVCMQLLERLR